MRRIALALVLLALLVPAARGEGGAGALSALHTDLAPLVDGTIAADEWETPAVEEYSAADVPPAEVTSGSFSGASDLRIQVRALYSDTRIFLAVRAFDDFPRDADRLIVELGVATISVRGDGTVSGPAGDWGAAVSSQADGWSFEIDVAAAIVAPITLPGAYLDFNLGYEDDDGGDAAPEGVLWRSPVGGGVMLMAAPKADVLAAAAAVSALSGDPERGSALAKEAARLEKAARAEDWPSVYAPAPGRAKKVLDRMRSAARKLEKIRRKEADRPLAASLDDPLARLERAARFAAAELVRSAVLSAGRTEAPAALEKLQLAEASPAGPEGRIGAYRKAAKKAAKLL